MDGSNSAHATLDLNELETQIIKLGKRMSAATYQWLTLIAEFDRRKGWEEGAFYSCAHWLNYKCGLDLGAAREKVRVAHALKSLPKISGAMEHGELSYSKVRAISRVATAESENYFLAAALHGSADQIERLVRQYRRAREAEELSREAQQHANRRVDYWYDVDGSLILRARLTAVAGAQLVKAIEAAVDTLPVPSVSAETPSEPPAARRADGLALVAEGLSSHFQVVVHVDADTLGAQAAGRCAIEHGPSLAAETARRLSCDSGLVAVRDDAQGQPLDVGRKTRVIPPAIRRALDSRDQGCRFPGCTHKRYVHAHHIHHWADGGETKLSNLVTLCGMHHRIVHEGGAKIRRLEDGSLDFVLKPKYEKPSEHHRLVPTDRSGIGLQSPDLREARSV